MNIPRRRRYPYRPQVRPQTVDASNVTYTFGGDLDWQRAGKSIVAILRDYKRKGGQL